MQLQVVELVTVFWRTDLNTGRGDCLTRPRHVEADPEHDTRDVRRLYNAHHSALYEDHHALRQSARPRRWEGMLPHLM
jgi:hypothetical protein